VLKIFGIMLGLMMGTGNAQAADYSPSLPIDHVETISSTIEKRVREAAVRVTVPFTGGHGSGSYIKYKDVELIFTAQHVADGELGINYLITYKQESHMATLIYSDPENDIAILHLRSSFRTTEPMKYSPLDGVADIGTNVVYSGYPSSHKLMSFTGRVAGYENGPGIGKQIILQTYGWFGCSGSVIYDTKGRQIGILYGVDVEYYPNMQVQENMIWVAPVTKIKIERALRHFCNEYRGKPPKACR
jgi:S1-C subfamily serine protease